MLNTARSPLALLTLALVYPMRINVTVLSSAACGYDGGTAVPE